MIPTSTLFKDLLESGDYYVETVLSVNDTPPDESYAENILMSVHTTKKVFSQDIPAVGGVIAGEISVEMLMPEQPIPRMAKLSPYVRLRNLEKTRYTEWIPKGSYYLDTRKKVEDTAGAIRLQIRGYDSIMKTEQDYPESKLSFPARDLDVVQEIADFIGVRLDGRTKDVMQNAYQVEDVTGYTFREVLGYIAAMYGGNFVMSDRGALWLVAMGDASADDEVETNYLINETRNVITFGGDRILV